MIKHIYSLFDPSNRWWTMSFFLASIILIIISLLVGIRDNLPGFSMLFIGMIFLFFTVVHPWRKSMDYGILGMVCVGIILFIVVGIGILMAIGKTEYISEAIVMGLFFLICLPGIVVSILGSIICTFINN
jgi:hypothetical protein